MIELKEQSFLLLLLACTGVRQVHNIQAALFTESLFLMAVMSSNAFCISTSNKYRTDRHSHICGREEAGSSSSRKVRSKTWSPLALYRCLQSDIVTRLQGWHACSPVVIHWSNSHPPGGRVSRHVIHKEFHIQWWEGDEVIKRLKGNGDQTASHAPRCGPGQGGQSTWLRMTGGRRIKKKEKKKLNKGGWNGDDRDGGMEEKKKTERLEKGEMLKVSNKGRR